MNKTHSTVVHVTKSFHEGGAGIAAARIVSELHQHYQGKVLTITEKPGMINWIFRMIRLVLEKIFLLPFIGRRNLFCFSMGWFGEDITKRKEFQEADIVHLHWMNNGFLSLGVIKKILQSGKRVFWTFHDKWMITGGCHVNGFCSRYLSKQCHGCPYLLLDFTTHKNQKKKIEMLSNVKIIAPSKWMQRCVDGVGLKAEVIYNPFNPALITRTNNRAIVRKTLGLSLDKKYVLFNPSSINSPIKGFKYFVKIVNHLDPDYDVLIIGTVKKPSVLKAIEGRQVHRLPNSLGFASVNNAYLAADVMIVTSPEENFPNTIIECLLCNTPVVAWAVGGIPEIIDHKQNGYLVSPVNWDNYCDDFKEGIEWATLKTLNTRDGVLSRFPYMDLVEKYINLYTEI